MTKLKIEEELPMGYVKLRRFGEATARSEDSVAYNYMISLGLDAAP